MPSRAIEEHLQQKLEEGRKLRRAGEYSRAEQVFKLVSEEAIHAGSQTIQAQALLLASGCQIRLYRYGAALQTLDAAKTVALRSNDHTILGAVATNVSSIYFVLGDFLSAAKTAEQSVSFLTDSPRKDYLSRSLIVYGDIQFGLGRRIQGDVSLTQAIEVAKTGKLPALEALAENHLAAWLILANDLDNADRLLKRALALSKQENDSFELAETSEHLAELGWRKGGRELRPALDHINVAISTANEQFKSEPQYYPIHIRGQILLSLGEKDKALAEFRRAVNSADIWRQGALPGDITSTQTVVQLNSVYHDCAQLAAELSLERDDHNLARESFEVLARNRAASLREQLTRSNANKLLGSPEYFDLLQQLQTAQADATLEKDPQKMEAERVKLEQIRARLSDLANRIGIDRQNFTQPVEKKGQRTSLKDIQARLTDSEALLSFSLGDRKSFLWAVTNDDVKLYDLPKQEIIGRQAIAFSHAVSTNGSDQADAGRALGRSLFANIAPSIKRKTNWILTPDGALLDSVPFAGLPASFDTNSPRSIVTNHTLRILPSAQLLAAARRSNMTGRFVGVSDPIYNLADSRRDRTNKSGYPRPKTSATVLGRLPGSELEVKASAEKCGLPQTRSLTGKEASIAELRQVLQQAPDILHFAVHVVSPKDFPQEAALALSLGANNLPELLTAESVATYRVPGSLVVLSGCASQQGEVLPGAGVVGLSRGWLLAGAAAVVVSAWPTPDESGQFFSVFYGHFRTAIGLVSARAAYALQQTQLDMQRGGGYRSEPKFWAAYSIISKE